MKYFVHNIVPGCYTLSFENIFGPSFFPFTFERDCEAVDKFNKCINIL